MRGNELKKNTHGFAGMKKGIGEKLKASSNLKALHMSAQGAIQSEKRLYLHENYKSF